MMKIILFVVLYPLMIGTVLIFGTGAQKPIASYQDEKIEKITFEKDIKPIMNTYCGGTFCHHGKPSLWMNYETVKAAVDKGTFYDRVIDKKDMPKRKPLPAKEYELIKKWLENGALKQ